MAETLIEGRYRLGPIVSADGFGEVFEAVQVKLGRKVLIKMLAPSSEVPEEATSRFTREATALSRLNHPSIVFVVDFGVFEGRPYLVREAVEGETLDQRLTAGATFSPEEALPILLHIAEALEHAHQSGVVHRDLRPENILLGADGRARVTDFGLVRLLDADAEALTAPGMIVGTSWYMAPERVKGAPADARSDLYALGVIGHRMLTGRFPFDAATLDEMLMRLVKESPRPITETIQVEEEAHSLCAAIDRMLARDPADRFPEASWVVNALNAAATDLALPDATQDAELLATRPGLPSESPPVPTPELAADLAPKPLPEAQSEAQSKPRSGPPPVPEPSIEDWVIDSMVPAAPEEEEPLDAEPVSPSVPEARGDTAKVMAAVLYVLALVAVTAFVVYGLPDAGKESRALVRAGEAPQVIPQLQRYTAAPDAAPGLRSALGFAFVHVRKAEEAVAEYAAAAGRDPDALEPPDVAALVALLGLSDPTTLEVERVLVRLGPRARPRLHETWRDEEAELYLRCRAGDVLASLGEQVDFGPICAQALERAGCSARRIVMERLEQLDAVSLVKTATSARGCEI